MRREVRGEGEREMGVRVEGERGGGRIAGDWSH